ncbi:MAG: aldo/keto reductase [Saprospiraceae bacterium]|nr:aldo/keto reductase [Saprospiraceae bacterium]
MNYNNLGNTGLLVSELCFGAMTFGGRGMWTAIGEQDQKEAESLMKTAFDGGINFFDNANGYSEGLAEEIMGHAIKNLGLNRQQIVIATKVRIRMGEGVNQAGLSRVHIQDSVEDSLRRLQLDHLDLLYIHGVDHLTPLEETMRGLEDVVRAGKVRYIGVCNHPAWMVAKANGIARQNNWETFKAMQYYYSVAGRDVEHDIIPYAQSEQISVLPWSPLAGGYLSGKYDRDTDKAGGSRRDGFDFPPVERPKVFDIIDVMREIAQAHQVSVAQVAIRWVMNRPGVDSTIIGARTVEQLKDNLNAPALQLTSEDMQKLDEVSAIAKPYPNWMVDFQANDRLPKGEK